jgi:(p)ppGpp synthase/HD superfamily hydrolase
MPPFAQTNLELFAQLTRDGWSTAELVRIRVAYEVAMRLFTGCFRPSGKTFLAHLVRTASIVADLQGAPALVVAGLLHAAYSHGEFGTSAAGVSRHKRRRLRAAVGADAEALIAFYTSLPWGAEHLPGLVEKAGAADGALREVLVLRLANELEEHLDLGALYCPNAVQRRAWVAANGSLCVQMADRLGLADLARALARAFEETRTGRVPAALQVAADGWDRTQPVRLLSDASSFLLPPASHRLRPRVAALRLARRTVRRARRAIATTRRAH